MSTETFFSFLYDRQSAHRLHRSIVGMSIFSSLSVVLLSMRICLSGETVVVDPIPLLNVVYNHRNVSVFTSASNPSRDPKSWLFWFDPMLLFDGNEDISQFHEQVRLKFSFTSSNFDELVRKSILRAMHIDVHRFAVFWLIEPLPVATLLIYIVDQALFPTAGVSPCVKDRLSGLLTFECQFVCSSPPIGKSIVELLLCGKLRFQAEFYVANRTNSIPIVDPSATVRNLNRVRVHFRPGVYLHRRQEDQLIDKYSKENEDVDVNELRTLFRLSLTMSREFHVDYPADLWALDDLQSIVNNELFYKSRTKDNETRFHLRNTPSPWALKSTERQTFDVDEIQAMFDEQHQLDVQWSSNTHEWTIRSYRVFLLSDVLDYLQVIFIKKQYEVDQMNATSHRSIDCSQWSSTCVCHSSSSAIVFLSPKQFVRITNMTMDFSSTGLILQLWIRIDQTLEDAQSIPLINFRDEYLLSYRSKGEILFSLVDAKHRHSYTTTLQVVPTGQWTHLTCVHSPIDNQLQLYVNGDFLSSLVLPVRSRKHTDEILLGRQFLGAVRDLRVWACDKTADEIRLLAQTESLFGNESCLVGWWPMNDATGQLIRDLSTHGVPRPATLGFDLNRHSLTDPIWAHVPPPSAPPATPRLVTYRIFRENITAPMVVHWGSIVDIPVPYDYDGDGFSDFAVYRTTTQTYMISSSNDPTVLISRTHGFVNDIHLAGDFDGDGRADYTLFRPLTAQWIIELSSNPAFVYIHKWGRMRDIPCIGDFDGDGKSDFSVYRRGTYYINPSSDPTVQWTKQWGQPGDLCVANCDFDGDGVTDFAVWTPTTSIWSWIPSGKAWLIFQKQWGSRYDLPRCADFDGDRKSDFVAYRPWTGEWFVLPYSVSSVVITYRWGRPTDIPVAGDHDADGLADFALWRPRVNNTYVWETIPSSMPVVLLYQPWGIAGDVPVAGDFDGDKKTDYTIWRPSNGFWYILFMDKSGGVQMIKHWGFTKNDTPAAGDWDGDLFTDYTIYRRNTGYWYIMLSKNPILQIFMQWGVPQYQDDAVPADYDGDGKSDFAVWRPSSSVWFILPSTNPAHVVIAQWGLPGDHPVAGVDVDGDSKADLTVWRPSTGSWYILPSTNPVYPYTSPFNIRKPILTLTQPSATAPVPRGPLSSAPTAAASDVIIPPS